MITTGCADMLIKILPVQTLIQKACVVKEWQEDVGQETVAILSMGFNIKGNPKHSGKI